MSAIDELEQAPPPLAEFRRIRAYVDVALEDLDAIRDRTPDAARDTIGSALLTARGELSALLGEDGD